MLGLLRHSRSRYVLSPNFTRLFSTAGSTSTTQQSTTHPLPPNPRNRKHKLDIRPIKVDAPPIATDKPVIVSSSTSESSKPTTIATAKQGIQSATVHGILLPPPADASWARKLLHQGKELFRFYWNGLKLIYTNRKMAKDIEKRVRAQSIPMTRWETVFVKTNKQDMIKLIPFVLILLVLEEALPLFVLYAPFLLPSTCLLISQRNRISTQRAIKQSALVSSSQELLEHMANAKEIDHKLVCGLLSLSTLGPTVLRQRRIALHLQTVGDDDRLLLKEASELPSRIASNLSHDEILQVLTDRGFMTTHVDQNYAQQCLEWYYSRPSRNGNLNDRMALAVESALFSKQYESGPLEKR